MYDLPTRQRVGINQLTQGIRPCLRDIVGFHWDCAWAVTRVGDKTPLFTSVRTTHKDSVRIGIGYPDPSTSGKPNASSGSRRYAKAPNPSQSIRPGLGTCTCHGSQLAIIPAGPAGFGKVQLVVATKFRGRPRATIVSTLNGVCLKNYMTT